MRDEKQETVEDIVAEMRSYAKRCREENFGVPPAIERHYHEDDVEYLSDRIEAAYKREHKRAEADALVVGGMVEAMRHEKRGNAAAMREALSDACYAMHNFLKTKYGGYKEMAKALDKAKSALSEPPRNCDVGTVEEHKEDGIKYEYAVQQEFKGAWIIAKYGLLYLDEAKDYVNTMRAKFRNSEFRIVRHPAEWEVVE